MSPRDKEESLPSEIEERLKELHSKWNPKKIRNIALGLFGICFVSFVIYVGALYQQLRTAFQSPEEYLPTLIYSDVTEISPPQTRRLILSQLKVRHYEYSLQGERLTFKLRRVKYPEYLVPENHRTLTLQGKLIYLDFDGSDSDATLLRVTSEENPSEELDSIYLEPEVIANLSRGEQSIRKVLKFEEFPSSVWKAIIAIEDQHFLDHKGLDPRGLV